MRVNEIWPYDLRKGNSDDPRNGACVMDAVSWFHTGKLGDHPECACPVLTEFSIVGNDAMSDDVRQTLKPFIFRLMGSRDAAAEEARLRLLVLAAARRFAPMALDAAGRRAAAFRLRSLPDNAPFEIIRDAAWAAGAAAGTAGVAGAAAEAAAGAAAGTAGDSARAAAGAARVAAEDVWRVYIEVLDEALNLGAQGSFDFDPVPRLRAFAEARAET